MSVGTFVNDIHDTIVAVASGPAVARRGIVRVSGPGTVELVLRCFQPTIASGWPTTSARRWAGRFRTAEPGQEPCILPVDLWLWPTVRTYTGQPSAEFHLPGIPYLLDQVVQQCLRDGARMAGPGEFTLRAFLAGRLDLLQAQAVLRVIEAQDPQQLHVALAQLAGGLSTPLQQFREQLIAVLAHLEAGLDFVEEEIEFISQAQLLQDLTEVQTQVSAMIEQLRQRREIGRLPRVVLVGPPNAGKSSLFNALLGQDLALVSPVQGTTRDYLSGRWQVAGRACDLIDTAGLEQGGGPARLATSGPAPQATVTADDLERLGQQQAWTLLPTADVLLLCWDATRGPEGLDDWLEWLPKRPSMLVLGKDDLAQPADHERWSNWTTQSGNVWPCYWVSPATGHGLNELPRAVGAALLKATEPPDAASQLESAQSLDDLEQIEMALQEAIEIAAQGGGEELVAAELHRAVERLGRLVGTIYTDDILDSIFSRFCIGK